MKKLKYFCSVILAGALLAVPAAAQKGKDRDNKGGAVTGDRRADLVKSTNKTPDTDKDKDPDNDKNDKKGKRKGFTHGKHKGRH